MPSLKAIDPPLPLTRLAYEALRDSILSGRLAPGVTYNEQSLAKDLGISKTPVREALLELATQGLMTVLPRRGVMVTHFTERDIEEVFEVRLIIEAAMAERVASLTPRPDFGRIEHALGAQEDAIRNKDMVAFVEADRRFHVVFGELVKNRRLSAILERARDLIHVMGREAIIAGTRPEEVVRDHRHIVKAILTGSSQEARCAMTAHIEGTRDLVLQYHQARNTPVEAEHQAFKAAKDQLGQ